MNSDEAELESILKEFDIKKEEFIEIFNEVFTEDSRISQKYQEKIREFKEKQIRQELKALEIASKLAVHSC